MTFQGRAGFQRIVYIAMNIALGVMIGVCVNIFVIHAPITFQSLLQGTTLSFFIGYTVSDLIPAMVWGQRLVLALGVKNSLATKLIANAVLAFFMGTCILFFNAFISIYLVSGFAGVMDFFVIAYPVVLIASFIGITVFVPPARALASKITGSSVRQAPLEE